MLTASRQKCDNRLFAGTQYLGYKNIDVADTLCEPQELIVRTSEGRLLINGEK